MDYSLIRLSLSEFFCAQYIQLHTYTTTNSAWKSFISASSNLYRILIYTGVPTYNYSFNELHYRFINAHSGADRFYTKPFIVQALFLGTAGLCQSVNNVLGHEMFLLKNQSITSLAIFKRMGYGHGASIKKKRGQFQN